MPLNDPSKTAIAISLADPSARTALVSFNVGTSPESPGAPALARPVLTKGIDDLVVADDGRVYGAAHLRLQVLRGDPTSGDVCVVLDFTERGTSGGEPTSARIAQGFGEWDGWLFTTDNAGEIWAVDIRSEEARLGERGAADVGEGDRATPAPSALVALAIVAVARYAARRPS